MLDGKRIFYAIIAGFTIGLAQYTFSAANFIPFIIVFHFLVLLVGDFRYFVKAHMDNFMVLAVVGMAVAVPLIMYAANNTGEFIRRAKDVSIMNEIKSEKSINPLIKNIKIHFLMFNFEGDYNGRHNLYKEPLLGEISGVLLVLGFVTACLSSNYSLYIIWFLFMLLGGILTMTIEAPQAYRIVGIVPVIYILIVVAIKKISGFLLKINKKEKYTVIFMTFLLIAICIINIHQYFCLYPKHTATFMSFSPVPNAVAKFINRNSKDYYILVSTAKSMYGFHGWEQLVVCEFITHKKGKCKWMVDNNRVKTGDIFDKKGVVFIVRPFDLKEINRIEREYKDAKKEVFKHPLYYHREEGRQTDVMFIAYYIDREKIKKAKSESDRYILYR